MALRCFVNKHEVLIHTMFEPNKRFISAQIPDGIILTAQACANIISELIKCLLYQRMQIPYSFHYLKTAVLKKRRINDGGGGERPVNLGVQNNFRAAAKVYDSTVEIVSNIEAELKNKENAIKEIVVLFGSTFNLAKEAYTIVIPQLEYGHDENVHSQGAQKCTRNVLRNILTSEEFKQLAEKSIPLTNIYILLKSFKPICNHFFLPTDDFLLKCTKNQLNVNINYDSSVVTPCCSKIKKKFAIFATEEEMDDQNLKKIVIDDFKLEDEKLYLAKINVKGFKDVFVNKISASELW